MKPRLPTELRRFVQLRSDVEAVLERCGRETFDLVLIDAGGEWTRWVLPSEDAGLAMAADLGIPVHRGWEADPRMTLRMNRNDPWKGARGTRRALY
jgi:hypothetical protein